MESQQQLNHLNNQTIFNPKSLSKSHLIQQNEHLHNSTRTIAMYTIRQFLALQSFLTKTIEYLLKYFKTVNLQSQQKTYVSINKICSKIQSKFVNQYAIESLAKKLCLMIQTKINDKQEDSENNLTQTLNNNKKLDGMKSFITNISSAIQTEVTDNNGSLSPQTLPMEAPTRLPSTDSEFSWIRKVVIEELDLLRDDIEDADDRIDEYLEQMLGKNLGLPKFVLFFQSFLNNKVTLQKIIQLGWTPIIIKNQKKTAAARKQPVKQPQQGAKKPKGEEKPVIKQISISEISSYLHKCQSVIISSDSITKTGGILSGSGGLMLCLMCKKRKIPVIAISRNYCLSDKVLLGQKSLCSTINPSQTFQIEHNDFGLYITKDVEYVEGKYIDCMITERGCWMVQEIGHVQDQYWRY